MTNEERYMELYNKMCRNCPNAKYCHDECEECDDFQERLESDD